MTIATCVVAACTTRVLARGFCVKHYSRWKKHGDPTVCLKPTDPLGATGECVVVECDQPAVTRRMCNRHYQRWLTHGDPLVTRPRIKGPCSVPECAETALARRLCSKHYSRWRKHGNPLAVDAGGRPLKGEVLTHAGVHKRLMRKRGKAAARRCVDCAGQASEWSYDNADPDELHEYLGDSLCAYSLDLGHYVPRCIPCHRRFDFEARQKQSQTNNGR